MWLFWQCRDPLFVAFCEFLGWDYCSVGRGMVISL